MSDHTLRRRLLGITYGDTTTQDTPPAPDAPSIAAYSEATNQQLAELASRLEDVNNRIGEMSGNFLASDTLRETATAERDMRETLTAAIHEALDASGPRNPARPILEGALSEVDAYLNGEPAPQDNAA